MLVANQQPSLQTVWKKQTPALVEKIQLKRKKTPGIHQADRSEGNQEAMKPVSKNK